MIRYRFKRNFFLLAALITLTFFIWLAMMNSNTSKGQNSFQLIKRYSDNGISFQELRPFLEKLKPGAILTPSHGKSVCALIPGKWKHTGIYLGNEQQARQYFGKSSKLFKRIKPYFSEKGEYLMVDGSLKKGVSVRCISEIADMQTASTLQSIICFSPKLSRQDNLHFIENALQNLGKDYDLEFNAEDDGFIYCTELICNSLKSVGIDLNNQSLVLDRNIILPDDMIDNIINEMSQNHFIYELCLVKDNNKVRNLNYSVMLGRATEY